MPAIFKPHRRLLWYVAAGVVLLAGAAVVFLPRAIARPCGNACINNLRQIDGAKEQWALETKPAANAPVDLPAVNAYIKGGQPKCPADGTYTYGNVAEPPRCSITGHSLSDTR